ncbi:NCS1 nucleoside transporter family [Leucosporidium creatinivorum]|uniref:NCS1 nucleoside transporter family n=1 Tax=Leucosporidium creatinivorum TaxID=106004 RepID=A0A1Y2G3S6_9BASI|nr:NCS1 nucleoside transporter family [Leucosporidium creatinivorum]
MGLFQRKNAQSAEDKPAAETFSVRLPKQASSMAPEGVWSNADLDPTPRSQWTWGVVTWWTFWLSAVADPAMFQTGSSLIPAGLGVSDAIGCVILANVVISIPIVLNGTIGSRLRIPFPVAARSSFGYWFSLLPVVSRAVLSCVWYSIETYNGGAAMTQCLRAMWPSYLNIPNHLPESAGMTTIDFCSYFLYWLLQLPFHFISPKNLRWFFALKFVYVPIVALATMGTMVHQAGGGGPLVAQGATAKGMDYASAWCLGFAALCGNWATLAVNSPDFTRYSTTPRTQIWQIPGLLVSTVLITTCGILAASASVIVYGGEALWSPFDIYSNWDNRAAVWFCSFGWIIGSIGANITANSISAANDLTSLFPKYINITRGQIITAVVGGWAFVPWKILSSGTSFLNFMSAYAVIMGPFAAIITADFWLVKKFNYDVPALYDPHGRYTYWNGINWRAVVTCIVTIAPTMPGLIQTVNPNIQVGDVFWFYAPGFVSGYVPALLVYWLLNVFFPHHDTLIASAVTSTAPEEAAEGDIESKASAQ